MPKNLAGIHLERMCSQIKNVLALTFLTIPYFAERSTCLGSLQFQGHYLHRETKRYEAGLIPAQEKEFKMHSEAFQRRIGKQKICSAN